MVPIITYPAKVKSHLSRRSKIAIECLEHEQHPNGCVWDVALKPHDEMVTRPAKVMIKVGAERYKFTTFLKVPLYNAARYVLMIYGLRFGPRDTGSLVLRPSSLGYGVQSHRCN